MVTLKINYNIKELERDYLTENDMLEVVREYAKENGIREVENGLFEKDGEHALCLLTKIPVFILNLDEKEHELKYYKSIILDVDGEIEDCIKGIKEWRKNESQTNNI